MTGVAFGIFDHLDRGTTPPERWGQFYENRLRLLELADRTGFHGYHVAEHHFTPLGLAPSPSVYLAAAATRTRRLRFGPLVYILPLYHPLRLMEEICMLDQMSDGRFLLGVGRGISPYELNYAGINFIHAYAMYEEALEVILKGLAGGTLNHHGRFYSFERVPMEMVPRQRPHPPIWTGASSLDSVERNARKGMNVVIGGPNARVKSAAQAFRAGGGALCSGDNPIHIGAQRHIVVAETDAEALALARPNYKLWYDALVKLWRVHNAGPVSFIDNLDGTIAHDGAIVGSPSTVRAEVERHLKESGMTYFMCRFAFGDLTFEQSVRSLKLFSEEVMPHFVKEAVA
jgi:alkanesulfonate monooxygenase SsuD/methylene tetrahydromethanopterin reductase-like flavin-dependent oxidoreductase (luciferase family)